MNVNAVYTKFQTPLNLQEHMLRVAALAEVILNNWVTDFPHKVDVIQACLFHDIAKPMTFNLEKQAQFGLSQEAIKELAELQVLLQKEYGVTEHAASVAICRKIGCTSLAVRFVDSLEWSFAQRFLDLKAIESLLPIYCDMRVAPNGILPLTDRLDELKARAKNSEEMDKLAKVGLEIESLIQKQVSVDLNQITNEEVSQRITALRQVEL